MCVCVYIYIKYNTIIIYIYYNKSAYYIITYTYI